MAKISFVALGGLDDHGKNMYALDIDGDILVIDGGNEKPSSKVHGVKTIIADTSWLKQNEKRIKGVFVSNYQDDHMAALPYLLKYIPGLNVYGSTLSLLSLTTIAKNENIKMVAKYNPINSTSVVKISETVKVKFFKITSQSLGHYGIIVETQDGNIIYATDFVYSNETIKAFAHDFNKLPLINKKTLLLLVGARYGKYEGFTAPKHKVKNLVAPFIRTSKNRTFFGCYDRDIYTIFEIISEIGKTGQKIAFTNKLTEKLIQTAIQKKLIGVGKSEIIELSEVKNYPSCNVFITDTYNDLYSTISQISKERNPDIKLTADDKFLLVAPPIPGNESNLSQVMDDVVRTGCSIKAISERDRKFMWASQEDIKTLVSLTEPRYAVPIRGLYRDLSIAREVINDAGVDYAKIEFLNNGNVISIHQGIMQKKPDFKIRVQEKFVEGNAVSTLPPIVLNERNQMAENGVLSVSFMVDKSKKVLCSMVDIKYKGMIEHSDRIQEFFEGVKVEVEKVVMDMLRQNESSDDIKRKIKNMVSKRCQKNFSKEPVTLVAMSEI